MATRAVSQLQKEGRQALSVGNERLFSLHRHGDFLLLTRHEACAAGSAFHIAGLLVPTLAVFELMCLARTVGNLDDTGMAISCGDGTQREQTPSPRISACATGHRTRAEKSTEDGWKTQMACRRGERSPFLTGLSYYPFIIHRRKERKESEACINACCSLKSKYSNCSVNRRWRIRCWMDVFDDVEADVLPLNYSRPCNQ